MGPSKLPVIHASRVGSGARAIVLEILGYEGDPIDEATQKIFDDGNKFEETAIKQVLHDVRYERPHEGKDEYLEFKVKLKTGHEFIITCSNDARLVDEFDDDKEVYPPGSAVEVKNVGKKSFKKYYNQTRLTDKYKFQAQVYLWAMKKSHEGKLFEISGKKKKKLDPLPYDKMLYIVRNKETRECTSFPFIWNEKIQKQILPICKEVAEHIAAGTIPPCKCDNYFCRYKKACAKLKGGDGTLKTSYHFNVSGTTFRKSGLEEVAEMELPEKNLVVALIPEPENKYDENAIRVEIQGIHTGYVPREITDTIRELILDGYKPKVYDLNARDSKPYINIFMWRNS